MGHMIPALGLGMLFNSIYKKSILPYLLIGFVFASYFGANTMSLAILGVAGGLLHLYFKKKEEVGLIWKKHVKTENRLLYRKGFE